MTLQVKIWADFAHVSEESDSETNEFQYKMFAVINSDDAIYYGELPTRKAETSFQQVMARPCSSLPPTARYYQSRHYLATNP